MPADATAEPGRSTSAWITPDGQISEFPTGGKETSPKGITVGPDGNIWYTDLDKNRVGRMTLEGEVTDYPLKKGYRQVQGITAGPDGNIWFTETHANTVSRLTLPSPSAEGKK